MKVLIFLDYFTPAYKAGGPIRVFEAVARSANKKDPVHIVTQNRDWGDPSPLMNVPENQWHPFENAEVLYSSRMKRTFSGIRKIISDVKPNSIHLNSLLSRVWTMKILLLNRFGFIPKDIRIFVSPHGELASSALGLKAKRKRVFLALVKAVGLYRNIQWIATSPKEVEEIKSEISEKAEIVFVPPPLPPVFPHAKTHKASGELKMIFLARLSAMKNIPFLLEVLPKVRGQISFDIFGPVDPEYSLVWSETLARFRKECPNSKIDYKGPVPSTESVAHLAAYDLFVQPSLSENFGYSIVEALSAGTPVLISDRTPWNEVNEMKIGAALPLENPQQWAQALQKFIDMDSAEWAEHSARAHNWVKTKNASGEALLKIYSSYSEGDSEDARARHSQVNAKTGN